MHFVDRIILILSFVFDLSHFIQHGPEFHEKLVYTFNVIYFHISKNIYLSTLLYMNRTMFIVDMISVTATSV